MQNRIDFSGIKAVLQKHGYHYLKINLIVAILYPVFMFAQAPFSFDSIFNQKSILVQVSRKPQTYRLQIIYTQINRDEHGKPIFKNYTYHLDSSLYFYCASLVKLPCAILALEKLHTLNIDKETTMFTDSAAICQHTVKRDTTAVNGYPSIAQYIRKMLVVSDNEAYGRVYEFLGVDELHDRLKDLGFGQIRIVHRFDGQCKGMANTATNPVSFYDTNFKLIYHQPQKVSKTHYQHPLGSVKVGKAYVNAQNKKINEPKDFTAMNYMSLQHIHALMQRLIFHDAYPQFLQYQLSDDDRRFLLKYLTMYPRESDHPRYNQKIYHDSYKKYFMYGDWQKAITDTCIKITNIVGQSHGFTTDCAYISNFAKGVEFMLSAVIYSNKDDVINDGKYEYKTIALPFLAELGRQIYTYELNRK